MHLVFIDLQLEHASYIAKVQFSIHLAAEGNFEIHNHVNTFWTSGWCIPVALINQIHGVKFPMLASFLVVDISTKSVFILCTSGG